MEEEEVGGERREERSGAEREREKRERERERADCVSTMKALLLLVLPWLSPANYTDNVGNLHVLYSEL